MCVAGDSQLLSDGIERLGICSHALMPVDVTHAYSGPPFGPGGAGGTTYVFDFAPSTRVSNVPSESPQKWPIEEIALKGFSSNEEGSYRNNLSATLYDDFSLAPCPPTSPIRRHGFGLYDVTFPRRTQNGACHHRAIVDRNSSRIWRQKRWNFSFGVVGKNTTILVEITRTGHSIAALEGIANEEWQIEGWSAH
ncbi:hypothetical protein BV22DRAFT_326005 [Leucogyrophana mollusca]|uniref:Uncharacterized protein n=1 Tax=Leucogyrophana mollusca TaxID=85980 RepID=A0ACB8BPP7_9AGAM|nr:hypothetical protein BV22DRAFT_326005 [Leucogyrophana mollusca]